MFEGFSFGTAVRLLINESTVLYKSFLKRNDPIKKCKRLVTNWVKYLILIHKNPSDIQDDFIKIILEHIELTLVDNVEKS